VIDKIRYIKNDSGCPLELLTIQDKPENPTPSVEKQLAHIYHYYIHGRESQEPLVKIIVTRYDAKGEIKFRRDLARYLVVPDLETQVVPDLETQIVTSAASSFRFTAEIRRSTFDEVNVAGNNTFKVGGILRYHPYLYDKESNPLLRGRNGSIGTANGLDNTGTRPRIRYTINITYVCSPVRLFFSNMAPQLVKTKLVEMVNLVTNLQYLVSGQAEYP